MKRARIDYVLDGDKRVVMYEADGVEASVDFPPVPVLIVQVDGEADADNCAKAIEKVDSATPKKTRKKASRPAPAAAGDGGGAGPGEEVVPAPEALDRLAAKSGIVEAAIGPTLVPSCNGPNCRDAGDHLVHDPATCPNIVGKRHARAIRERVEGKPA